MQIIYKNLIINIDSTLVIGLLTIIILIKTYIKDKKQVEYKEEKIARTFLSKYLGKLEEPWKNQIIVNNVPAISTWYELIINFIDQINKTDSKLDNIDFKEDIANRELYAELYVLSKSERNKIKQLLKEGVL